MAMKLREWRKLRIDKELYTLQRIENTKSVPEVIFSQYNTLWDMYEKGEYYGALYQIKDVLELSLKFPLLIMLAVAAKHMETIDEADVDMSKIRSGLYGKLDEFFYAMLGCDISFGLLEKFGQGLALLDEVMVPSKYRDIFLAIQKVLQAIVPGYYNAVGLEGKQISNWRNRVIGHGALDANKENVKKALEPVLMNLNAIMSVSDYSGVHIVYENKSYSVWIEDESNKVILNPYIILNAESELAFASGNYLSSFFFDTFNYHREQARLLDYINNRKVIDVNLSFVLTSLAKKFKANIPSDRSVDSGDIDESDEAAIMDMEPRDIVPIKAFFEETQKLLAQNKGILLLRSERGTGKTVFSRSIMNNFDSEGGNSYRLKINDRNYDDAASMLLPEDSDEKLYVCVYNFNNSWMCTTTSFAKALGDSLYPKKADHPSYYNAESNFRSLLSNKNSEVKKGDGKSLLEYQSKLKKAFNYLLKEAYDIYLDKTPEGCKLLIVLDGIDEIPDRDNAIDVADLLDKNGLPGNVYVLILARPESEWPLPKGIKDCKLQEISILKDRFSDDLLNYAKNNLPYKNMEAQILQDAVNMADMRILHLQIMCYIARLGYKNSTLKDIKQLDFAKLPEIYAEQFKSVSERYHKDIKRLLAIIGLLRAPQSISELYYIFTSGESVHPGFKFYALLKDLRGFWAVTRKNKVNYYSIANEAWSESLSSDYFKDEREEVKMDMLKTIDAILDRNIHWDSTDIELFKSAVSLKDGGIDVAKNILTFIEESYERLDDVFEANFTLYMEITEFLKNMESEDYELEVQTLYVWLLLNGRTKSDFDIHDEQLKYFFGLFGETFSNNNRPLHSKELAYRLLGLLSAAIKSEYYLSCINSGVMCNNYAFCQKYVEICRMFLRRGLLHKNVDMLYDLLLFMKSIPRKGSIGNQKPFTEESVDEINKLLEPQYAPFYRITRFQYDLINSKKIKSKKYNMKEYYCNSDGEFIERNEEIEKLLNDAVIVAESKELSKQEKVRYFKRLLYFCNMLDDPQLEPMEWKFMILSKNIIPLELIGREFVNKEIVNIAYCMNKYNNYKTDEIKYRYLWNTIGVLEKYVDRNVDDSHLILFYYYLVSRFELRGDRSQNTFSLNEIVQKFEADLADYNERKISVDKYVVMSFYLEATFCALECELLDYADVLLMKHKEIVKQIDTSITSSIVLFRKCFIKLINKLTTYSSEDESLFNSLLPVVYDADRDSKKSAAYDNDKYVEELFKCFVEYAKYYNHRREVKLGYEQCIYAFKLLNKIGCKEACHLPEYGYLYNYFKALDLHPEADQLVECNKEYHVDPSEYMDSVNACETYKEIELFSGGWEEFGRPYINLNKPFFGYCTADEKDYYEFYFDVVLAMNHKELSTRFSFMILHSLNKERFTAFSLRMAFKCCQVINDYTFILDICNKRIEKDIHDLAIRSRDSMDNILSYFYYREKVLRAMGENILADKDREVYERYAKEMDITEEDLQDGSAYHIEVREK